MERRLYSVLLLAFASLVFLPPESAAQTSTNSTTNSTSSPTSTEQLSNTTTLSVTTTVIHHQRPNLGILIGIPVGVLVCVAILIAVICNRVQVKMKQSAKKTPRQSVLLPHKDALLRAKPDDVEAVDDEDYLAPLRLSQMVTEKQTEVEEQEPIEDYVIMDGSNAEQPCLSGYRPSAEAPDVVDNDEQLYENGAEGEEALYVNTNVAQYSNVNPARGAVLQKNESVDSTDDVYYNNVDEFLRE